MNAIGLIETKGLIPAIEAADSMLKTAQVELVERAFVGGGLVAVTVTGDVGAVKAAVDAGVSAVLEFGEIHLKSHHVIPRPHHEVDQLFLEKPADVAEPIEKLLLETSPEQLSQLSVKKLRQLASASDNLGLSDQALRMANKATLLKRFSDKRTE